MRDSCRSPVPDCGLLTTFKTLLNPTSCHLLHLFQYAREIMQLFTIGLWQLHDNGTRVTDERGAYVPTYGQEDITNFLNALKNIYKISEDWYRNLYRGLNLEWDYYKREVLVSIPNYVTRELHKFRHPTPKRSQNASHQWTRPNYGATKQLATPLDASPPIPEE